MPDSGDELSRPLIEMRNIAKSFGGIQALKGVNLDIHVGEVHVLLGENGAGKSTLMKVLSGVFAPTSGEIKIGDETHTRLTPGQAAQAGISIIYQELSIIDELSALENLFVGNLPVKRNLLVSKIDWTLMRTRAQAILAKLKININLDRRAGDLPIAHKQILEIAKALMGNVKVLVMDEPTSSLTRVEIQNLLQLVSQLRQEGMAILFISHKFDEVRQIGDRFTVLKDGSSNGTGLIADFTNEDLVQMMVGRALIHNYTNQALTDESPVVLKVSHVTSATNDRVCDVSFQVRHGEVFGFAGLIGSGRTELMECLFGADKRSSGKIELNGRDITPQSPSEALKNGMAFITENRRKSGFFQNFTILENIIISKRVKDAPLGGMSAVVNRHEDRRLAEIERKKLAVKSSSVDQMVTELSGGNQQKVIVAKWMATEPDLIIFDEPTRGIDVGAKAEIYAIIRQLALQGKAIIVVSSELAEVLGVCDRIAVYRDGSIATIVDGHSATEETLLSHAIGGAAS
ncbi:ATP-binding cassette domain-containing protein [Brucella sp. NBRC 12950]|uniref:sugar ABC transporter ATP-binding protein n=1 Tax=Brucella sp. NBRC 12950 TaxID=2994518 RepID=UPI0024A47EF7|nr:ATP-binding cassette domain-containing protein [Brucella sp. NBRC 12950]GLU27469.1 cytochrome c6 [Brucella sp. NBRC 12950]